MVTGVQTERALTRRGLVKTGAAGTAALSLAGLGRFAQSAQGRKRPSPWRRSSWSDLEGSVFRVGRRRRRLRLIAVEDLPAAETVRSLRGREGAFTLVFEGSGRAPAAGTRTLRHPRLGRTRLFMTPIDPPGTGGRYAAIINRARG